MAKMKLFLASWCLLIATICSAQTNKFEAGDFGIRYGVQFNGSAVQGLTFSGMVTSNIEVGCGLNVQYATSSGTTNSAGYVYTNVNNVNTQLPTQTTITTRNTTVTTSFNPFVFYHFKIKNNLDVYTGPSLIVGTGTHTLINSNDNVTQGDGYYSETYNKNIYPLGYQVGGGLNVGGQYFFYKRLAIGVQASIGCTYSSTNGDARSSIRVSNSGYNNSNSSYNVYSSIASPYVSHSLSLTTASSIGVNLTFYVGRKAKAAKEAKMP